MSLKDEWSDYENGVMPHNAGPAQRQETRRAFYAGAMSFYRATATILDMSTDEPTQNDLQAFQEIMDELKQFGLDVAEGRA